MGGKSPYPHALASRNTGLLQWQLQEGELLHGIWGHLLTPLGKKMTQVWKCEYSLKLLILLIGPRANILPTFLIIIVFINIIIYIILHFPRTQLSWYLPRQLTTGYSPQCSVPIHSNSQHIQTTRSSNTLSPDSRAQGAGQGLGGAR